TGTGHFNLVGVNAFVVTSLKTGGTGGEIRNTGAAATLDVSSAAVGAVTVAAADTLLVTAGVNVDFSGITNDGGIANSGTIEFAGGGRTITSPAAVNHSWGPVVFDLPDGATTT